MGRTSKNAASLEISDRKMTFQLKVFNRSYSRKTLSRIISRAAICYTSCGFRTLTASTRNDARRRYLRPIDTAREEMVATRAEEDRRLFPGKGPSLIFYVRSAEVAGGDRVPCCISAVRYGSTDELVGSRLAEE